MEFEKTGIYPYVREHLDECKLMYVPAGTNFCPAYDDSYPVWYVVEGIVDIKAVSQKGKVIDVDTNVEDEFAGHLSNYWGQNFYCSCFTRTDCKLLRVSPNLFRVLVKDSEFRSFFYFKTSVRLYEMFKLNLASDLFSDKQLFANYLMENTIDDTCTIDNVSELCKQLKMSRRNFYNILKRFERDGLIENPETGKIVIINARAIAQLASPVSKFMNNEL